MASKVIVLNGDELIMTLTLHLPPNLQFTDEEFEQIIAVNQDLRLELTAQR